MKNKILGLIIVVLFFANNKLLICQEAPPEPCEINEINTHPEATPSAVHLDNIPQDGDDPDERFINNFYWWTTPGNISLIPLENMGLTIGEYYGSMQPINSQFFINHYMYLSHLHREVMLPENGWELLSMNTGVYPDNSTLVDMEKNHPLRSIPYLLFYNKYTGVARIFVRYGENSDPGSSINAAEIHIQYEDVNKMSGILRNAEGIDRTLDRKSSVQMVTSRVPSPGDESLWFSTDFQLAYDPCVCHYDSELNIFFRFFNEASIDVAGFFQSATQDLSPQALFDGDSYNHSFLNAFNNDGNNAGDGYVMYKHMNNLIDDYLERLSVYENRLSTVQDYNSSIENHNSIMKIAKLIFSLGTGSSLPSIAGDPIYQNNVDNIPEVKDQPDKTNFGEKAQNAFFKELSKALSTGFDLFISSSFNPKTLPSPPKMPTATFGEMKFSGTLSSEKPTSGPTIRTPGSLNSHDIDTVFPTRFPVYNESVGVFALLEEPQIALSEWQFMDVFDDNTQSMVITNQNELTTEDVILKRYEGLEGLSFRLKEPLKYTFNPALDIEDYSISANIEYRGKMKNSKPCINNFLNMEFPAFTKVNIESNYNTLIDNSYTFNPHNNDELIGLVPQDCDCEGPANYQHCDSEDPYTNELLIDFNTVTVPIDDALGYIFNFGYSVEWNNPGFDQPDLHPAQLEAYYESSYYKDNEIMTNLSLSLDGTFYLKLIVDVVYAGTHQDGSPLEYSYLFTYEVTENGIKLLDDFYEGFPFDFGMPWDNEFIGTQFDGSEIHGCELSGTNYLCQAQNEITLSGNINVSEGYNVYIEAGNSIVELPEATVTPEITLTINQELFPTTPMPPQDLSDVAKFCKGEDSKYEARIAKNGIIIQDDETEKERIPLEPEYKFNYNLYPNPASGNVTVALTYPEGAYTDLYVTNLSGQRVLTGISNGYLNEGEHTHSLATESLAPGIYLVTLVMNGEPKVKRLVKQ